MSEATSAASATTVFAKEASPSSAIAPVPPHERISSVDVLRGVALLGILLLNIIIFGLPGVAAVDPTAAGGDNGLNFLAWLVNHIFFDGKMRALFSMLFGAGVILFTTRAEQRGADAHIADIYYRRTLWLIGFGLLHAYFLWVGDILFAYGIIGLMLYPLRKAHPYALILAGVIILGLFSLRCLFEARELRSLRAEAVAADAAEKAGKTLTAEEKESQKAWTEKLKELRPDAAAIAKTIAEHREGYWKVCKRRAKQAEAFQSIFFYRFGFLDIAGMMLIGMGFLKLGILTASCSTRFYKILILCGYGLGVPLNAYTAYHYVASHYDPIMLWSIYTTYALGRFTVALGHIGVVMLICKAGALRWMTSRLAAVGQLALTNYLGQSLICTTLFYGYGFGLFGRLERYQLMFVVLGVWLVELAISPIWLRFFRFGPMEWIWRSLTYWQLQPMRYGDRVPPIAVQAEPAL